MRLSFDKSKILITLILIPMLGIPLAVISLAIPLSKEKPLTAEATRLRNALLVNVGLPSDVSWHPNSPAEGFLEETVKPPVEIDRAYQLIHASGSNFEKTLRVAAHLRQGKKKGGFIMDDTVNAYRRIVQEGQGYCADYTQVFNALAHAGNIPVREWGLSFDGFGGRGHAFSEIYDFALDKWIFIDVFNSFYVKKLDNNVPLSVLEFRDHLLNNEVSGIDIIPIVSENFGFKKKGIINKKAALDYYLRGKDEFYLWKGNNVFSYDSHILIRFLTPISRSLEQLMAIALGIHPEILILRTEHNQEEIDLLVTLRYKLIFAAISEILLFSLLFAIFLLRRRTRVE